MEEIQIDEEENPPPPTSPFWLKSTKKRRRFQLSATPASSVFFSTGVFVAILTVSASLLLLSAVPSFISYTQQVIRPSSVKKGWDSVNLFLVAFAIVCAFLGKNNQESPRSNNTDTNSNILAPDDQIQYQRRRQEFDSQMMRTSSFRDSRRWYGYGASSHSMDYDDDGIGSNKFVYGNGSENATAKLRRTSSSYPDLSQVYYDQGMRSYAYDDSYVRYYNYASVDPLRSGDPQAAKMRVADLDQVKDIEVDTHTSSRIHHHYHPITTAEDPPPPPPEQQSRLPVPKLPPLAASGSGSAAAIKVRKLPTQQQDDEQNSGFEKLDRPSGRRKQQQQIKKVVHVEPPMVTPTTTRSPSPPQPSPVQYETEESSSSSSSVKRSKKRGSGSATKDIFTTIYQQSKRKMKQKRKSHENLDDVLISRSSYSSSPPPPPPPPPRRAFQNALFSSSSTKKSVQSAQPPRTTQQQSTRHWPTKSESKTIEPTAAASSSAAEPVLIGSESPFIPIPIPPPPPPPPFKIKPWKFVRKGDYVKIVDSSNDSPRSCDSDSVTTASPSESASSSPAKGNGNGAGAGSSSSLFCPSPDVNLKADDFIARFKSTLKLEKMNSINQKQQQGLSPLRPDSTPSLLRT